MAELTGRRHDRPIPPAIHRGPIGGHHHTPSPLPAGSQYRVASSSPAVPPQTHGSLDELIAALKAQLAQLEAQAAAATETNPAMPTTVTITHMPPVPNFVPPGGHLQV